MGPSARAGVLGIVLIAAGCVGNGGAGSETGSVIAAEPDRVDQLGPYAGGRIGPIHVGAISDISGATGKLGEPYSVGVRHYIDRLNASGGVEGVPIRLWWGAYQSIGVEAEQLDSKFKSKSVVAILGWGTPDVEARNERVEEGEVAYLTCSGSGHPGQVSYDAIAGTTCSEALPTCGFGAGEPMEDARAYGYGNERGAAYAQGWCTARLLTDAIGEVIRSGSGVTGPAIRQALEDLAP